MAGSDDPYLATEAIASIESVGSEIEAVFAAVGGNLGTTHTIFADLNSGLATLSQELSGAKIEGACTAFQEIAARLSELADKLPAEAALLGELGDHAAQASSLLKQLVKHIEMVTVIARSSKIEAASLDGDRDDFLSFTRDASELAIAVQRSIVACAKDQEKLSDAVIAALAEQLDFEKHYRSRLLSVSAELGLASSEIKSRQAKSCELAQASRLGTGRISDAVGNAIVSLQAGDSTRQRLEHICAGLRSAAAAPAAAVPAIDAAERAAAAPLVELLQAVQLDDAVSGFAMDSGQIKRFLSTVSLDSTQIAREGQLLYGGGNQDATSFPAMMKQRLAQATVLISACGRAMQAVDGSIHVLEQMLAKFRTAISALDDTIIDITLIGMNAALKAAHLGAKGRAFVVIANELQLTAERIATGAKLLEPVLDQVGQSANRLKSLRAASESVDVADLETLIMQALHEIELGNDRLGQLMNHLTHESLEFQCEIAGAHNKLSALDQKFATLPAVARRLQAANRIAPLSSAEARTLGPRFDSLYQCYTMDAERDLHRRFCAERNLPQAAVSVQSKAAAEVDDMLF
jgi:uncharacterized protein YukE